jgi:tRNA pseudouridine55 synthase
MNFETFTDVKEGDILLVDKPLEWTSSDVVRKIKYKLQYKFKQKWVKVGHAGTLDPLASGLVIVNFGKQTKKIEEIQAKEKVYIAEVKFGATTPSYDLETEIDKTFPHEHITTDKLEIALKNFEGEQHQKPPVFSAKKIDGKRAYDLARAGKEVEMKTNLVHFYEIKLEKFENKVASIYIRCSKGTYIRSFAYDLGLALNSGAHLVCLRRCAIGNFSVENAFKIEEIEKKIENL